MSRSIIRALSSTPCRCRVCVSVKDLSPEAAGQFRLAHGAVSTERDHNADVTRGDSGLAQLVEQNGQNQMLRRAPGPIIH